MWLPPSHSPLSVKEKTPPPPCRGLLLTCVKAVVMTRHSGMLILHFLPFSSQIWLVNVNTVSSTGESLESSCEFSSDELYSENTAGLPAILFPEFHFWFWLCKADSSTQDLGPPMLTFVSLISYVLNAIWSLPTLSPHFYFYKIQGIQGRLGSPDYQGSVKDCSIIDREESKNKDT